MGEYADETLLVRLAMVLTWGEAEVLSALMVQIGGGVERLNARNWTNLATFLGCMRRAAGSDLSELDAVWFSEVEGVTAKMAPLLLDRVMDRAARRRLARGVFFGDEGREARVLRWVADNEVATSGGGGIDWSFVEHLSKRARASGSELLWWGRWPEDVKVPEEVATTVLSESEKHCEQMVAICESSYRMQVTEKAEKVSVVAERDDWFALS